MCTINRQNLPVLLFKGSSSLSQYAESGRAYRCSQVVFFIFVVVFEIGSLVCGVAPSSTAFIIGRAVAGIGGAGLFNGALSIVSAASTKEQRPSKNLKQIINYQVNCH